MIEIAIGAKVLVTQKINTDLDVMNGAWGKSVDIVLHPNEPPFKGGPIVKLKYLLAYLLVKMERTQAPKLEGLAKGIIPIEPASHCLSKPIIANVVHAKHCSNNMNATNVLANTCWYR